ncbi:sigma-54-dependent Fis family transcriptional regulator, partial [bacterium]
LAALLKDEGYITETARDGFEGIEKAKVFRPDVLVADLQMPRMDGMETIAHIKEQLSDVVPIILTAHGSIRSAVEAIKQGIYDYLTKPFDNDQLLLVVRRAVALSGLRREIAELRRQLSMTRGVGTIVGESQAITSLRAQIMRVAETDATVLIQGETGTGKELAARAIHFESKRKEGPFLIVDCTALPSNLIESEFFGHEKGAFTDAREKRSGKFEEANGGSIFLDEIGELPLDAQSKLLRVLQEKEFTRVGGTAPVKTDVRVIAATNKDLETEVRNGSFREDLFYRLNVLMLHIPPLREHREDIAVYIRHFFSKHKETVGQAVGGFSETALGELMARPWKGNIRELENAIQRAMLTARGEVIEAADLNVSGKGPVMDPKAGLEARVRRLTEDTERQIILEALAQTKWNRTAAAEKLKISRKTLFNKMQLYGLER